MKSRSSITGVRVFVVVVDRAERDVVQNIRSRLGFGLELQAGHQVLATSILTANPGPLSREPTPDGVGSAPHHGGARCPQQPAQVVVHLASPQGQDISPNPDFYSDLAHVYAGASSIATAARVDSDENPAAMS